MKLSLTTRLKKYGSLAIAGAAATTAVQTADAAIVYSGVQNIAVPADFTGVYLDMDGVAFNTTGSVAGSDFNVWNNATGWDSFHPNAVSTHATDGAGGVLNLSSGDAVDGSLTYTNATDNFTDAAGGGTFASGSGFVGISFNDGRFGWIQVNNVDFGGGTFNVVDWAVADLGDSITAGQTAVPEPGSLALLGLGGIALLRRRRR